MNLILPKKSALPCTGAGDPLRYYYWPLVGKLYRDRINQGLAYLPPENDAVLEIGYGSGLLMPTLAGCARKICGVDIHDKNREVGAALEQLGVSATLLQADARHLPFPDASFDAVVAFSFMEHVKPVEPFLQEMQRVLRPGGIVIVGMPMVNKAFNFLFHILNYHIIEDQHITSPSEVRQALKAMKIPFKQSGLPAWCPSPLRIYTIYTFSK